MSQASPYFSVIMPAYKAQNFIIEAVESVIRQIYKNWELIIISDDQFDYFEYLKQSGLSDKRIKLVTTGGIGSGVSHARNIGIQHAQYDFISLLDSDDFFLPNKLKEVSKYIENYDVVSNAIHLCNENKDHIMSVGDNIHDGALAPAFYKQTNYSGDAVICFNNKTANLRFDENISYLEDMKAIIDIFSKTEKLYHISKPLHVYRKRNDGHSVNPEAYSSFIKVKKDMIISLKNKSYPGLSTKTSNGLKDFLEISIEAEKIYNKERKNKENYFFEHALQTILKQTSDIT